MVAVDLERVRKENQVLLESIQLVLVLILRMRGFLELRVKQHNTLLLHLILTNEISELLLPGHGRLIVPILKLLHALIQRLHIIVHLLVFIVRLGFVTRMHGLIVLFLDVLDYV